MKKNAMLFDMRTAIVTGAGGFIGHHFVNFLKKKGYKVTGVDIKKPEFTETQADMFILADLRDPKQVKKAFSQVDEVYLFAADMGGVGYIQNVHAPVVSNNVLIDVNSLRAAHELGIKNVFFASSACVYPEGLQQDEKIEGLKETMAHPADPDTPYGWEKLFIEQVASAFNRDYGMKVRVARLHNIYGPEGTYEGGREKAPAALCRKVAAAAKNGQVSIWGDGEQTRSFCYIDDCTEGIYRLMQSDYLEPVNIGSTELVSINEMAMMIAKLAKKNLTLLHDLDQPQGVRGRNSDNELLTSVLNWQPKISLKKGLQQTYRWISARVEPAAAEIADNAELSVNTFAPVAVAPSPVATTTQAPIAA